MASLPSYRSRDGRKSSYRAGNSFCSASVWDAPSLSTAFSARTSAPAGLARTGGDDSVRIDAAARASSSPAHVFAYIPGELGFVCALLLSKTLETFRPEGMTQRRIKSAMMYPMYIIQLSNSLQYIRKPATLRRERTQSYTKHKDTPSSLSLFLSPSRPLPHLLIKLLTPSRTHTRRSGPRELPLRLGRARPPPAGPGPAFGRCCRVPLVLPLAEAVESPTRGEWSGTWTWPTFSCSYDGSWFLQWQWLYPTVVGDGAQQQQRFGWECHSQGLGGSGREARRWGGGRG